MRQRVVGGLLVAVGLWALAIGLPTGRPAGDPSSMITVVPGRSAALSDIVVKMPPSSSASAPPSSSDRFFVKMLVPAYFYPSARGSDWDAMTAALETVGVVAIMNPASGPDPVGEPLNPDYIRAVNAFRAAGGVVLGYVPSGYSGRRVQRASSCKPAVGEDRFTVDDLASCAARYTGYQIDGIFVDEMGVISDQPEQEGVKFYTKLYDKLKAINVAWTVFGNPGTNVPESYLRNGHAGGADTLITYEDRVTKYFSTQPEPYTANYPAERFGNIVLGKARELGPPYYKFRSVLTKARSRNVGYIYMSDESGWNPYSHLPAKWTKEVALLGRTNPRHMRSAD